ncbi:hypothetical protein BOTBODRAFT_36760 [Botryobasidium botryosum FD-172 SS1]|uniref:Uncharacterized protein n=1 Tax=Botryobasidium botryosum (strain FD-172 SS1) TaxID=930990 RepID=A0A067MD20_BOTB1|nr:hypothetical protein BOTBODRAFT_36760 [Botryobasidium botryosum FD-172 SS1]
MPQALNDASPGPQYDLRACSSPPTNAHHFVTILICGLTRTVASSNSKAIYVSKRKDLAANREPRCPHFVCPFFLPRSHRLYLWNLRASLYSASWAKLSTPRFNASILLRKRCYILPRDSVVFSSECKNRLATRAPSAPVNDIAIRPASAFFGYTQYKPGMTTVPHSRLHAHGFCDL